MKKITNYKDVLVLTTSSIEGYNILEYNKPISSHVVAGLNLVSEFFGGLSDVFGGRSNEFQNQLNSIYNESISKLKQEAFSLGCNCIIGLKVDIDEISGKGKSMFMITAIGTAIIIENQSTNQISSSKTISSDELNNLLNKQKILSELRDNKLAINSEIWESLISNQIYEALDLLIEKYKYQIENSKHFDNEFKQYESNFLRYIKVIDLEVVSKKLYTSIAESKSNEYIQHCYKLIKDNFIVHFPSITNLLDIDELPFKKTAISLTKFNKQHYNFVDIKDLKNLISAIDNRINEYVEYSKKKKNMFSSDEIEVWKCSCGHTNNKEDEHCYQCEFDKYGFKLNSYNKQIAINNLTLTLNILKEKLQ